MRPASPFYVKMWPAYETEFETPDLYRHSAITTKHDFKVNNTNGFEENEEDAEKWLVCIFTVSKSSDLLFEFYT